MRARQTLPRLWLMTDERIGEALWPSLARLPRGAGVVFRHYRTNAPERRRLYERVRTTARRRRLVLVLAGTPRQAIAWRAAGVHGRGPQRGAKHLLRTTPAHDAREGIDAARSGADLMFVSPVFATRSHPGKRTLGIGGFGRIARSGRVPTKSNRAEPRLIALGGMNAKRFRQLCPLGAYGWAAIDALTLQKRKVVPR